MTALIAPGSNGFSLHSAHTQLTRLLRNHRVRLSLPADAFEEIPPYRATHDEFLHAMATSRLAVRLLTYEIKAKNNKMLEVEGRGFSRFLTEYNAIHNESLNFPALKRFRALELSERIAQREEALAAFGRLDPLLSSLPSAFCSPGGCQGGD